LEKLKGLNFMKKRCAWVTEDKIYQDYHDHEWGVPVYDDRVLFEFLLLEGAQAGLSWLTVLKRRESYREAFANFDPQKVAKFSSQKVEKLLLNPGIIRNRLKVEAAITNAKCFLEVQREFGSFANYSWQFVGGKPLQNKRKTIKELPPHTEISDAWSKDMKRRGFKFVGSTILYAHMQAVGMVNDHTIDCFRHAEIARLTPAPSQKNGLKR